MLQRLLFCLAVVVLTPQLTRIVTRYVIRVVDSVRVKSWFGKHARMCVAEELLTYFSYLPRYSLYLQIGRLRSLKFISPRGEFQIE